MPGPTVVAHADALVADASGVTGRAGQHRSCRACGRPVPGLVTPVSRAKPTGKPSKFSTGVGRRPATDTGAGAAAGGSQIAEAAQGRLVGVDGFRTGQETEPFQVTVFDQQAGSPERTKPWLFQRDVPGIGHLKGRGALARMVEPVPVFGGPVLVEPIGRLGRRHGNGGGTNCATAAARGAGREYGHDQGKANAANAMSPTGTPCEAGCQAAEVRRAAIRSGSRRSTNSVLTSATLR